MRTLQAHDGTITAVAYLPDGRLVSAGWDQTVALWDLASGGPVVRREFAHPILALAVSPEGTRIAVSAGELLSLWSPGADPVALLPEPANQPALALAWSRDGEFLAGASLREGYHLYDTQEAQFLALDTTARPLAVGFADAGQLLLVSSTEVYLGRPGQPLLRVSAPFERLLTGAIAPRARAIALGGHAGALAVLDRTTGQYRELPGHTANLLALTFSRDGQFLLSACLAGVVRVWDVPSCRELAHYDWGISSIRALAIAPDGMTAVAAGFEGLLLVWDLDGL
jgi:WD40 repeat protein